ncbi:5-carboxymethyl-2-hydroxymuconate Delta-isomerase [Candidatus Uabimicrobium amorphum]|uniref:5-carboxymethyl-2-hydroxymuconate isomerase n=1 Tax=Uabimicrobium amorphum TaxID=2596890 RepID=A0A5S9IHN0_UABAM|nr:hypothetical protein [Candidatus Uabimicrobium amorphum]BBM81730.1 5-carboxymethyl-2-hydroxymuconate isomerase [Candidatus Uabimicrobium amorphum]
MPHIKIELSQNIEMQSYNDLFLALQKVLQDCADVPPQNCKSRVHVTSDFLLGDEKAQAFVHLEIALLEGRSPEVKSQIGENALKILNEVFTSATMGMQITVEVRDILRPQYFKKVHHVQ